MYRSQNCAIIFETIRSHQKDATSTAKQEVGLEGEVPCINTHGHCI